MRKRIALYLMLLLVIPLSYGNGSRFWGPNDGLSNSHIIQIMQDHLGYIWIATENGLNRFNGYDFTTYAESPVDSMSLRGNYVNTMLEDSAGRLWVGTIGGLFLYDRELDCFRPYLIESESPFYLDHVTWILEDDRGNIWLSNPGDGIICLEASTLRPTFYNSLNSEIVDNINHAYCDLHGNLWLGTYNNGVYLFNPERQEITHFTAGGYIGSLSDDRVFSIGEDAAGHVLIGTLGGGVNIYDNNTQMFSRVRRGNAILEKQIYAMTRDSKGNVWLGTDGSGIIRYDRSWKELPALDTSLKMINLSKSKVHYLFEDSQGNMWIALYQKGILLIPFSGYNFKNYSYNPFKSEYDIGNNCVISVIEDNQGYIWAGTDGDGLYKLNSNGLKISHFTPETVHGFPSNVITSLYEDSERDIWIGTYVDGLFRYNHRSKVIDMEYNTHSSRIRLSHDHVSSIYRDSSGIMWVGTNGGGLNRIDMRRGSIKYYHTGDTNLTKISSDWLYSICSDIDGTLWLGTSGGINHFSPATERFSTFSSSHLNTNLTTYTIHQDHKGDLWFGGLYGLYHLDKPSGVITRKTTLDGLPSNMITGIEEDDAHHLWLSTGNGLCRYDPASGECLNFYAKDGIQSNEFRHGSHCRGIDGRIYFGGINGLTSFTPSQLKLNNTLLHLSFTDLLIYNEPVQAGSSSVLEKSLDASDRIRLKYNQQSFTFTFAALEYGAPHRVQYYTQMENFDKQWRLVNSGNRSVTYTNLSPGSYTFKVKATLDNVNFLERKMEVIISPPFYSSIWAKILYIILIFLGGYGVYLYIINRIRQRQALMEKEQQKQISEAKLQFFTDISHEIRTPLTLILGPIEKLEAESSDGKTRATYKIIRQNALRILRLVNQLMDLRAAEKGKLKLKIEETSLREFIEGIMDSFRELADAKGISFSLELEEGLPNVYIDKDCLDKAIFNLLSNAFKFTSVGGRIVVRVYRRDEKLAIMVEDSGIGIALEHQQQIFDRFYQVRAGQINTKNGTGIGLHLSKMMIELHHGDISVESELGKGSKFLIQLPLAKESFKPEQVVVPAFDTPTTVIQPSIVPAVLAESADPEPAVAVKVKKPSPKKSSTAPKGAPSILLVEDDMDILKYIESELSIRYNIYKANDGKIGLSEALKHIPDVVVSDVVMPEMDGLTMCKMLKTNDKTCHIPIILLTARTSVEQRIEGIEVGADAYIPKPFSISHLETRIEKLIELRRTLKEKYSDAGGEESELNILSSDESLLQKFNEKLLQHISDTELSVDTISKELGLSRVHLNRRLRSIINDSPGHYIRVFRLKHASILLTSKRMTIAEVAYAVGFGSQAYFSNLFRTQFGMSPSEYVNANRSDAAEIEESSND